MGPKRRCFLQDYYFTKRALQIINFQPGDSYSITLFKSNHISRFEDKILIENVLLISKSINNLLPPIFNGWFTFCPDIHNYETVSSSTGKIFKPSCRPGSYRK